MSLRRAVELGGSTALQQIAREQLFQQVAADPGFQQAVRFDPNQKLGTQLENQNSTTSPSSAKLKK
jgi:hypothetical protein